MSQNTWEADKMLDVYIYDYLCKRNLVQSAKAFMAEGKVSPDPVAIDAPGGFLYEWWSVFWDIFIARTNEKHSDVAASYIETQQLKLREQQLQQQQGQQQVPLSQQATQSQQSQQAVAQQQQQQLQLQQLQLQLQQQRQFGNTKGGANGIGSGDPRLSTANALATKIYEERLKQSQAGRTEGVPGDGTDFKPNLPLPGGFDPQVHPSLLRQSLGTAHGNAAALQQARSQQLMANPALGQRWALSSGDALQQPVVPAGGSQFQFQNSQQFHQFQMLSPQQQRQLLMQAQARQLPNAQQANLMNELEARRIKALLSQQKGQVAGKEGTPNDGNPGVASPGLSANSLQQRTAEEQAMLIKQLQQQQQQQQAGQAQARQVAHQQQVSQAQQNLQAQQQQQQQQQQGVHNQGGMQSQQQQQKPLKGPGSRKRKQAGGGGPASSTGTASTAGASPSTPSGPPQQMGSPGGGLGMQQLSQANKSSLAFGDPGGLLGATQLPDFGDRLGDDGSLEDNVESFLSAGDNDPADSLFVKTEPGLLDIAKEVSSTFSFNEVGVLRASTNKVVCCHFSADGKLLASGGHDKKALLWSTENLSLRCALEEHSLIITDVRFSPNSNGRLATSSFDKTVKVWDAENPSSSMRTFAGHNTSVTSVDFHPSNDDLVSSCDSDSEIRYWSVNQGHCTRVFKGASAQIRFQPRTGQLLAAATENLVSIFDVESEAQLHALQRHTKTVQSICWDMTGEYVASVSEDSVRVWALRNNSGECIHELISSGNKFNSCTFHPNYHSLLVIGCYQSLELWNMVENKSMTIAAHDGLITALAQSPITGMVASASHDKTVKLWK